MSLQNDFDGLFVSDEYEVIDSVSRGVSSGKSSQSMPYGAADGPNPEESYINPSFLGKVRRKLAKFKIGVGLMLYLLNVQFIITF